MRKWVVTGALVVAMAAAPRADVTVVQSMSVEGAVAVLLGSVALPRLTMQIKGMKARADVEVKGQLPSSIVDVATKQVILLDSSRKKALIPNSLGPASPVTLPRIDVTVKPPANHRRSRGRSATSMRSPCVSTSPRSPGGTCPPKQRRRSRRVRS